VREKEEGKRESPGRIWVDLGPVRGAAAFPEAVVGKAPLASPRSAFRRSSRSQGRMFGNIASFWVGGGWGISGMVTAERLKIPRRMLVSAET
jgi:hypothetical protein